MQRPDQPVQEPRTWPAGRVLLRRRRLGVVPLAAGATLVFTACGDTRRAISFPTPAAAGGTTGTRAIGGTLVANPAKDEWPPEFLRAAPPVQEAYRYALSHPEVLQYMPCFCGCGSAGHQSNKDCYIREARPDGSFVLDPMSFG